MTPNKVDPQNPGNAAAKPLDHQALLPDCMGVVEQPAMVPRSQQAYANRITARNEAEMQQFSDAGAAWLALAAAGFTGV